MQHSNLCTALPHAWPHSAADDRADRLRATHKLLLVPPCRCCLFPKGQSRARRLSRGRQPSEIRARGWGMSAKYVNSKGKRASGNTVPPDTKQCQANPNMMRWSPMSLGPRPVPVRCTNPPVCVVVENRPNRHDNKIGSMSLCDGCLALMRKQLGNDYAHANHLVKA